MKEEQQPYKRIKELLDDAGLQPSAKDLADMEALLDKHLPAGAKDIDSEPPVQPRSLFTGKWFFFSGIVILTATILVYFIYTNKNGTTTKPVHEKRTTETAKSEHNNLSNELKDSANAAQQGNRDSNNPGATNTVNDAQTNAADSNGSAVDRTGDIQKQLSLNNIADQKISAQNPGNKNAFKQPRPKNNKYSKTNDPFGLKQLSRDYTFQAPVNNDKKYPADERKNTSPGNITSQQNIQNNIPDTDSNKLFSLQSDNINYKTDSSKIKNVTVNNDPQLSRNNDQAQDKNAVAANRDVISPDSLATGSQTKSKNKSSGTKKNFPSLPAFQYGFQLTPLQFNLSKDDNKNAFTLNYIPGIFARVNINDRLGIGTDLFPYGRNGINNILYHSDSVISNVDTFTARKTVSTYKATRISYLGVGLHFNYKIAKNFSVEGSYGLLFPMSNKAVVTDSTFNSNNNLTGTNTHNLSLKRSDPSFSSINKNISYIGAGFWYMKNKWELGLIYRQNLKGWFNNAIQNPADKQIQFTLRFHLK